MAGAATEIDVTARNARGGAVLSELPPLDQVASHGTRALDPRSQVEAELRNQGNFVIHDEFGVITLRTGQGAIINGSGPDSRLAVRVTGPHNGQPVDAEFEFRADGGRGYVSLVLRGDPEYIIGQHSRSENNNGGGLVELYRGRYSGQTPGMQTGEFQDACINDIKNPARNEFGEVVNANLLLVDQTPILAPPTGNSSIDCSRGNVPDEILRTMEWLNDLHLTLYRFYGGSSDGAFGVLRVGPESSKDLAVTALAI